MLNRKKLGYVFTGCLGLLIFISFLMISGCSRQEQNETIRIGAIDPLTGPFAAYGEPVRNGMLLAVDEINAGGGYQW